jgi:MSHA pilin protein MshD
MSTGKAAAQRGLSLVELIVFIVVVSAAVAGVLGVFAMTSRGSADPMIQKQALSIAEAVLEEVLLMPFTYCDPDDATAATALSATVGANGCTATVEGTGPEGGEDRYSVTVRLDNVNDYHNFDSSAASLTGIRNIDGSLIAGLTDYRVRVSVAGQALGGIGSAESLLVTVTVDGPASTTVVLHGYRTRYAPNALP